MTDVETDIYTRLKDDPQLMAAMNGDPTKPPIYELAVPQVIPVDSEHPAIVYQRIGIPKTEYAISGRPNLTQYRMQLTIWGGKINDGGYAKALAIESHVLRLFDRKPGGGIEDAFLEDAPSIHDPETNAVGIIMDWLPWYSAPRWPMENRVPTYDGGLSGYTVNRGTSGAGTFTINRVDSHYADPDGDALVYTVAGSDDAVATVTYAGGSVVMTHKTTGVVTVTLTATDPSGLSVTGDFTVTFTGVA